MAVEASLEDLAAKIARAIHEFAGFRRWSSDSYHLYMIYNSQFSRLRVTLFAEAFAGRTREQEAADYNDISDAIEAALGEDLNRFSYIGLILTADEDQARERAAARIAAESEIDDVLLNTHEPAGSVREG